MGAGGIDERTAGVGICGNSGRSDDARVAERPEQRRVITTEAQAIDGTASAAKPALSAGYGRVTSWRTVRFSGADSISPATNQRSFVRARPVR